MLTRCPACETHFRVTAEQLKARSGRVRCGECQHVFNALDSLIEEPMAMTAPRPPESPSAEPGAASTETEVEVESGAQCETGPDELALTIPQSGLPDTQSESAPSFDSAPEIVDEASAPPLVAPEPAVPAPTETDEPETAEPETIEADTAAESEAGAPVWSETFPEPAPPPRRWPWAIGGVLALIALGLQALLAFRVELAVLWPDARPTLVALCDIADCEVGLPAKIGLVGIEASDLHPDGGNTGRLMLMATLKNRAPFAQQFPHLELTLTDNADKAVARKVLAAADYLPAKSSVTQGMPPNADIAVAVAIDSGEMAASGYRLYLFYP